MNSFDLHSLRGQSGSLTHSDSTEKKEKILKALKEGAGHDLGASSCKRAFSQRDRRARGKLAAPQAAHRTTEERTPIR